VHVVEQYDGRLFDDYESAMAYVTEVGFPALMEKALQLTADPADGSLRSGSPTATYGRVRRRQSAGSPRSRHALGALDPAEIDVTWPRGAPAQVHYTFDDPFREQEGIDAVVAAVKSAGATIEVFDYPGAGHVFADPSKADEYQPAEAQLMWSRVTDFVERIASYKSLARRPALRHLGHVGSRSKVVSAFEKGIGFGSGGLVDGDAMAARSAKRAARSVRDLEHRARLPAIRLKTGNGGVKVVDPIDKDRALSFEMVSQQ